MCRPFSIAQYGTILHGQKQDTNWTPNSHSQMSRLFSEGLGPAVWRAGLADPHRQWKRSRSAWELAVSWESRRTTPSGLPAEIETALAKNPHFQNPVLLFAAIEHSVVLDDPRRPSQNDLWAVLLTDAGHVSMTVEGKAGEDFDKTLAEWLGKDSPAKRKRLAFLCETLGVTRPPGTLLRYQLFHRAASPVIEARRCRLPTALMTVQSFGESPTSWQDYTDFAAMLGLTAERNAVCGLRSIEGVDLYLAWIDSPLATDAVAAAAV
jgi:hypothetical protein